jgi:lysophospholipase L1-like esterase
MFDAYIALGDSMSIDFYPAQDAEYAGLAGRTDVGSAALFYRNDPRLFPEFDGRDLITQFPRMEYANLCLDGATCEDLLSETRLKDISHFSRSRSLITLTLGGNDLLGVFRSSPGRSAESLVPEFAQVMSRYNAVLETLKQRLPNSVLMLTTVFDPTDGTGIMPLASPLYQQSLPIEFLNRFNDHVRQSTDAHSALLADVHKHFLGHGAECGASENFWYWKASPIEPSWRGAGEIRRVWFSTLEAHVSSRCSQ